MPRRFYLSRRIRLGLVFAQEPEDCLPAAPSACRGRSARHPARRSSSGGGSIGSPPRPARPSTSISSSRSPCTISHGQSGRATGSMMMRPTGGAIVTRRRGAHAAHGTATRRPRRTKIRRATARRSRNARRIQSITASASSSSPTPVVVSCLRCAPTPRKLKRTVAAPASCIARAAVCTTLFCIVPPCSGCGWHTTPTTCARRARRRPDPRVAPRARRPARRIVIAAGRWGTECGRGDGCRASNRTRLTSRGRSASRASVPDRCRPAGAMAESAQTARQESIRRAPDVLEFRPWPAHPGRVRFLRTDPAQHVRMSSNRNPHLRWTGVPSTARSLVLLASTPTCRRGRTT